MWWSPSPLNVAISFCQKNGCILDQMEKNAGILYERNAVAACLRIFREKGYRLVIFKG